jgi:hypothetical protein
MRRSQAARPRETEGLALLLHQEASVASGSVAPTNGYGDLREASVAEASPPRARSR